MQYGAVLPNVGGAGDARLLAELSRVAEESQRMASSSFSDCSR